jgi:hypothetical protein
MAASAILTSDHLCACIASVIYAWNPLSGAVVMASVTSGFAGVYIEKILKRGGAHQVSLWMRNIQLAGFSLLFASFGVWSKDRAEVVGDSPLSDFALIAMGRQP